MHDLVHDLAQHVAGEEIVMLTKPSSQYHSARHVHIGCRPDNTGEILPQVHNTTKLRSFVLMTKGWDVGQQLRGYKWLRALSLSRVGFVDVPSCIGELKLLRYLVLSDNHFERLPDSVTNLLNLLALDLTWCSKLKALPDNFRKLINLRYLNISQCSALEHMPAGFGELSSLQYLSHFKVGNVVTGVKTKRSGLDALSGLQQLKSELFIEFANGVEEEDWDGDECWKLPISPQGLHINSYPGMRLPHWANNGPSLLPNFVEIKLKECYKVKYLPPLRCLPYLKRLELDSLDELEYIEEEEEEEGDIHSSVFFPCLEFLELKFVRKLKGWSRRMSNHLDHVAVELETSTTHPSPPMQQHLLSFPLLSLLSIMGCPELKYMPPCPRICRLELGSVGGVVTEQFLSSSASSLERIVIKSCSELTSVEVEAPTASSLHSFEISYCSQLKNLHIAHPNVLEELEIYDCRKLVLSTGVDWDSLPNLRTLQLYPLPPLDELPQCLVQRQALGELEITENPFVKELWELDDSD